VTSRPSWTRYAPRFLQAAIGITVLVYAIRALARQWSGSALDLSQIHPDWVSVGISGLLFLLTYAVLIEMWREVLRGWGARLRFWPAARIWTISNLGRYVPGKVIQIGAMGVMAERAGVSPVAATGSAILNVVVNLIAGFLVVAVFGWPLLQLKEVGGLRTSIVFLIVCVAALILMPLVLPRILRAVSRLTGRDFNIGALPRVAILIALAGNVIAWLLYGAAFAVFAQGVFGSSQGALTAYIAVYALSYLVGYLVLIAPAGAGFREAAMIALLPAAHLADPAHAAILAVTSRLWLTVLEIAPGAIFLGLDGLRRRPRENR
jgi:hypothetical protein